MPPAAPSLAPLSLAPALCATNSRGSLSLTLLPPSPPVSTTSRRAKPSYRGEQVKQPKGRSSCAPSPRSRKERNRSLSCWDDQCLFCSGLSVCVEISSILCVSVFFFIRSVTRKYWRFPFLPVPHRYWSHVSFVRQSSHSGMLENLRYINQSVLARGSQLHCNLLSVISYRDPYPMCKCSLTPNWRRSLWMYDSIITNQPFRHGSRTQVDVRLVIGWVIVLRFHWFFSAFDHLEPIPFPPVSFRLFSAFHLPCFVLFLLRPLTRFVVRPLPVPLPSYFLLSVLLLVLQCPCCLGHILSVVPVNSPP